MLAILGIVMGGVVGPVSFALLGRYNKLKLAFLIAGLMAVWLLYLLTAFLRETHDISRVAISVAVQFQLGYFLAAGIGWALGRLWRCRALDEVL